MRMEVSKIPKYRNLTKPERVLIAQWVSREKSNKWIAKELGRNVSTIGREIKRNSFRGEFYEPLYAHYKALKKRKKAWTSKYPLKNVKVYTYTINKLRDGWSPEQIAGRLKQKYPDNKYWQICHETIYRFIYSKKAKELLPNQPLWEYLRRKQKRRRKHGRKSQRVRIPDRVSIHKRPKEVDQRKVPGHWEGDSIIGKGHTNGLHTEYERVTSLTKMKKVKRVNADETVKAQKLIFGNYPKRLRRSTTLDNGSENTKHKKLQDDLDMDTFFADPYASWQRGGNENANMWIRYYFPKGTDFSKISDKEIQEVENELNNRPRKRLGYKTPMEVFAETVNCKGLQ
jgi:transposase, IS30 family